MSERDPYTIRMARRAKNAIDGDFVDWLSGELDTAGSRPLLLTGSDNAFCAGLDLKRVAELDADAMLGFLHAFDVLVTRLFLHPAPTVAWVNGHAIAGGCVLALACDHAVVSAEPRIKIGLNEVALGACFPPVTLRMVRHRLSAQAVERVLLGAGLFGPDEARALGLVDEVSSDAEALAARRLAELAGHPAAVYAHTKRLLREGAVRLEPADERRLVDEELAHWTSEELRARVRAVLGG